MVFVVVFTFDSLRVHAWQTGIFGLKPRVRGAPAGVGHMTVGDRRVSAQYIECVSPHRHACKQAPRGYENRELEAYCKQLQSE